MVHSLQKNNKGLFINAQAGGRKFGAINCKIDHTYLQCTVTVTIFWHLQTLICVILFIKTEDKWSKNIGSIKMFSLIKTDT
jgi:hypothetical protein